MKTTFFLLLALVCFNAYSQDYPDMDYPCRFYYLKGTAWENMERLDGMIKTKVKGLGYGGAESFVELQGPKTSNVRFTMATMPVIAIRFDDNTDPSEAVHLFKVEYKKEIRIVPLAKKTLVTKLEDKSKDFIKFTVKKLKDKTYQLVFDLPLPPGEYAFGAIQDPKSASPAKITCFGID